MNPHDKKPQGMRGYLKGTVPRAQPAEPGLAKRLTDWSEVAGPQLQETAHKWWDNFVAWIVPAWNLQWGKMCTTFYNNFNDAIDMILNSPFAKVLFGEFRQMKVDSENLWSAVQVGIKAAGQTLLDSIINPIKGLQDIWKNIFGGGGSGGPPRGPSTRGGQGIQPSGIDWAPSFSPSVRGDKFTKWDATFDAAGKKYGISPAFLKAVAQQENVATGDLNPLGISPGGGGPTHFQSVAAAQAGIYKQVAFYANPRGPYAKAVTIDDWAEVQAPWRKGRAPNDPYNTNRTEAAGIKAKYKALGGDPDHVIINNHTTYNIHGGDITHQIAALHQKHIQQMAKDLEEVNYRHERSRFS